MDLTQLRYFRAIAQTSNISAAARALNVSQPSLTVAIQKLEAELKTTLFLRDRQGVTLTESGRTLLEHAMTIFDTMRAAEQKILGIEEEEVGSFIIGCHESLGAYFLPAFMTDFLKRSPRVDIALWNGSSAGVRDAVVQREVHFGIVVNPSPHPDLVLVELFPDAVKFFVSASEPVLETIEEARARIANGPLIYAGRVAQMQELVAQIAEENYLPARQLACGDLELVKSLALAGVGVALLPHRVAAYGHENRLRPLHRELPFVADTIRLVYRADMHKTRAAMALKDALVRHGRTLAS
jgi:DNA-binding transcriptional LysR family regulator